MASDQAGNGQKDDKNLESLARIVLSPHEVLRDKIYGDIWINLLERKIIDTIIFQRLRGKMQLGPTHMVYPGATHTRFEHSLGTLHMADRLVVICNRNCKNYPKLMRINNYQRLLIRLIALLHDAAHIPFGHTLEREGNLFEEHEWKDKRRANAILGKDKTSDTSKDKTIYTIISDTLKLFGFSEKQSEVLIGDLFEILTHDGDPMTLKYPFIHDIVGNTLCADLLDYSVRDMHNCGLAERWGDRFLNYLGVLPLSKTKGGGDGEEEFEITPTTEGKGRLVLLSYRYERDRHDPKQTRPVEKPDVLSEAIDLLRKRHSLAEKVYFHRTKIAASAMIISAVQNEGLGTATLFKLTDDQLLSKLSQSENERVKALIECYLRRNLFKPIYKKEFQLPTEREDSRKLWNGIYEKYRNPEKRRDAELKIERDQNLSPGSILIYCPESGMNAKEFEALVHPTQDSSVKKMEYILDPLRKREMEIIDEYFHRLWVFEVLVDPEKIDPTEVGKREVRKLSGYCEDYFGLPNDIPNLKDTRHEYENTFFDEIVDELEKEHRIVIPHKIVVEVRAGSRHYASEKDALKKRLFEKYMEHKGEHK
jgi:hypothetical protein